MVVRYFKATAEFDVFQTGKFFGMVKQDISSTEEYIRFEDVAAGVHVQAFHLYFVGLNDSLYTHELVHKAVANSRFEKIELNIAKGYYLLSIINGECSFSRKIIVK